MKIKITKAQVKSGIRGLLKVLGTLEGATSATKFGQIVGWSATGLGFLLSYLEHKEEPKSPEGVPPGFAPGSTSVTHLQ